MKTLNQVVTVLLLIFMLVLLPIVATVPDAVLNVIQSAAFAVEPWVMTTVGRVVTGVVAALLWLIGVWVLWREIRQGGDRSIRVTEVEEGMAKVAEASVAKLLETRLSAVADVKTVSAKVRQTKEGVVAELILATAGGVRVPDVTRAAIDAARSALEGEIGAKVAKIDVRVREVGRVEGTVMASIPSVPSVPSTPSIPSTPTVAPAPAAAASWSATQPEPVIIPEAEEPEWHAPQIEVTGASWEETGAEAELHRPEWTDEMPATVPPIAADDGLELALDEAQFAGCADDACAYEAMLAPEADEADAAAEADWDEAVRNGDEALTDERDAGQA